MVVEEIGSETVGSALIETDLSSDCCIPNSDFKHSNRVISIENSGVATVGGSGHRKLVLAFLMGRFRAAKSHAIFPACRKLRLNCEL